MAKRTINWSKNAVTDLLEILDFYSKRNKSTDYSIKLNKAIKKKLKSLDFSIALPQKTTVEGLYYFTHNHISVCFEIADNDLKIMLVIDERRSPDLTQKLLKDLK